MDGLISELSTLRCRRCRKAFLDSSCLHLLAATDESAAVLCSVWHVNLDKLPEWILTSVQQAHWTVGKLNCQSCGARLGGFNFVNHASRCPCGQMNTAVGVHISKSRVDPDHRHSVRPSRPGGPQGEQQGCLRGQQQGAACRRNEEDSPRLHRNALALPRFGSTAGSHAANPQTQAIVVPHTEESSSRRLMDAGEATQSLLLSVPTTSSVSCGRRCMLGDEPSSIGPSGPWPAGPAADKTRSMALSMRPGTVQCVGHTSPAARRRTQRIAGVADGAFDNVPRHSAVPRGRRSTLDQEQTPSTTVEGVMVSSPLASAPPEEAADSPMFLRGTTIADSIGEDAGQEQEEQVLPQQQQQQSSGISTAAQNRLNKRERNRLKSVRRKQRRRERWLHSQLEQEQNSLLTDSEEEDREGYTCAVCLEVYYSPYSCHPCGHVFCEPCLRTLAKNRSASTPCPLCRTHISSTVFHKDLNQTVKTFFPKIYNVRKQTFQNASCAKWPLPSCRKRFRIFWGYQRQAAGGRRWHMGQAAGGFTLDALDLADMRGWLFDIDLVVIYIHSVNWILAFLLLCFLLYFFFS